MRMTLYEFVMLAMTVAMLIIAYLAYEATQVPSPAIPYVIEANNMPLSGRHAPLLKLF